MAMGKAGRGPIYTFAAGVEAAEYMLAKLDECICKAPMMLERGSQAAILTVQCQSIKCEPEAMEELTQTLQQMPGLQQGLREGAVTDLYSGARDAVLKL